MNRNAAVRAETSEASDGGWVHPVVVACATDANYLKPLATMLRSVIENLDRRRKAEIYILHSELDPRDCDAVTSGWPGNRCTAHWIAVDESSLSDLPLWGRMPVSTYFKLAVTDALPSAVKKAIWLDSDLIVLGDLGRLWDSRLDGKHLSAVQDRVVPLVSSRCGVARYEELGMAGDEKYFNAGVMLLDLTRWRLDRISEQALDYLRRNRSSITFWDQEGLNVILVGKWAELDGRWNYNASMPRRHPIPLDDSGSPWVVHFAGNLKPWRYRTRDPERSLYYRYLDMTAWAGWRPRRSIAGAMVSVYERSGLRTLLYPAENWGMRVVRNFSRRTSRSREAGSATSPAPLAHAEPGR